MKAFMQRWWLLLLMTVVEPLWAALPQAPAAAGGAGGSDYIASFKTYSGQAVAVIVLLVGAAAFLVVAWLALQALIEAVNGRGGWAQVILLGIVGSFVLVFDLVLLNQAAGIFGVTTT